MKLSWVFAAAMLAMASAGSAATVSFDETLTGDVGSGFASASDLGSVDLGDQIKATGGLNGSAGDFRDVYSFTALSSFQVDVEIDLDRNGGVFWLISGEAPVVFRTNKLADFKLATGDHTNVVGTFGAGDYFFFLGDRRTDVSSDYTVTVRAVAPVSVPAGLPLLLGGIGTLVWMRRRKKA